MSPSTRFLNGFLALVALLAPNAAKADKDRLEVHASIHVASAKAELVFEVRNVSQQPIGMYEHELPWGNSRSVLVLAINPRTHEILPPATFVDDPVPLPLEIKPGEMLRGSIALDRQVQGIDDTRRSSALVVFWYYDVNDLDGSAIGSYGGWFHLDAAAELQQ